MNHTPGPWNLQTNTVNYRSGMKALQVRGTSDELIATFPGCDRDKANARLIAAAPELLKTMQALIDVIEMVDGRDDSLVVETVETYLRAAIAKASGK